jgi:outer membrane lipoprotein carrier protein
MRIFLLLLFAAALPGQNLGDLISGMELHYNRLGTLQLDFEQELRYAGSPRALERGTLYLLRPQRMRWDYTRPSGKLLVGDGEKLQMYNPNTNQVRTVYLDDSADMRAPLAFLLGRLNLRRQFKNLKLDSRGRPALIGEGRSGKEQYTQVEFYYDPAADFRLDEVKVLGRDESITIFRFTNEVVNPRLDPVLVEFTAPPDAEILPEQRLGDQ